MTNQLPAYRIIDQETWPRREHFQYYTNQLPCGYSLTSKIDVTEVLRFSRTHGRRFYGCFIYLISKTVNEMDEMKMMLTPDGTCGIWDIVHPVFTVFHEDDHTFSDLWTQYRPDFSEFYKEYEDVTARYGNERGIKGRSGQPANFFCISCIPWMDYTGYATHTTGNPNLFPIITYGKYTEENGRYTLPLTLTIAHAAADGYHAYEFFRRLQEYAAVGILL